LGSRASEKFVRFYDKFAESHGVLDCYRFELELKDSMANTMFALVLEFPDNEQEYQRKIIDYAVSSVDFVERIDKNMSRNHRLEWWDAWLSRLKCTRIFIKTNRVKTSISAKKNWVQRSVAKTLLMIQKSIGVERLEHFLLDIMHKAQSRISSMDELILSDYARNGHLCYMASIIE
jgi:DNA relaxase NicK